MLVADPWQYVSCGSVLLCEIMFVNGMDCRVVCAVNLPSFQFIDWICVLLISDKQYVKLVSCGVVVWEHYCPMNYISSALSPADDRLLHIKNSTNMYQNSSLFFSCLFL